MYLLSEDQRFFFSLQYHEWMNGTRLQIIGSALLRWLSHLRTVPIAKHGNSTMKAGHSEGRKYLIHCILDDFGHIEKKKQYIILLVGLF